MKPFDTRYGKMSAFGKDDLISRSLRKYGEWSGIELALLAELIPKGGVVVDAGAYIGTHARAFSNAVGAEGVVHAFEPNPDAYRLLQENAALAPIKNITCHPLALGEQVRTVALAPASARINAGSSRVVAPKASTDTRSVAMSRLDRIDVGLPDFIKIDVEGMELAVLQGSEGLLPASDPVIFAECNSLEGGARIMLWAREKRLKVRGAWSPAFNPDNFLGSSENEFGNASEIGLLLVSTVRDKKFGAVLKDHRTVLIRTVDDLALLLLKKAQYAGEVLARTSVAKAFGIEFASPRAERLQEILDEANRENAFYLTRISNLEEDFMRLSDAKDAAERISEQRTREAAELTSALEAARAVATSRLAEIEAIDARVAVTDEALADAQLLAEKRLVALAAADEAFSSLEALARDRLQTIEELARRIELTDLALEQARILAEERQSELQTAHAAIIEIEALASARLGAMGDLDARVQHADVALAEAARLADQRLEELKESRNAIDALETLARERLAMFEEQARRCDRAEAALEKAEGFAYERLLLLKAADGRFGNLEVIALQRLEEIQRLAAQVAELAERVSKTDKELQVSLSCVEEAGNEVPVDTESAGQLDAATEPPHEEGENR